MQVDNCKHTQFFVGRSCIHIHSIREDDMSLERYRVSDLKKLCQAFGIKSSHRNKSAYTDALRSIPSATIYSNLAKVNRDLILQACTKGWRGSSHDYSYQDWEPLENLKFLSLFGLNASPLALLLLVIRDKYVDTQQSPPDYISMYCNGTSIGEIFSQLEFSVDIDAVDNLEDYMETCGYNDVKGHNIAVAKCKQIFEISLSQKEEMQFKFNSFFASEDLESIKQGLHLMESIYELDDICSFFGFTLDDVFPVGVYINKRLDYDECPLLVELLMKRYSNPTVIGYLYLWLVALVNAKIPQRVNFENNRLSFFFEDSGHNLMDCFQDGYFYVFDKSSERDEFIFSSIPYNFTGLESIHELVLPSELINVPASLLCLPNLKALAIIGASENITCSNVDELKDSNVELIIVEEMENIPDFVWKFPKLKYLMAREGLMSFEPPPSEVEHVKIDFEYSAMSSISIENLGALKSFTGGGVSACTAVPPNLENLSLSGLETLALNIDLNNLTQLSVEFASGREHVLSLQSIPNIETFSVYNYTGQDFERSLFPASNASSLTFTSSATNFPSQITTWPNITSLYIAKWTSLESFPVEFRTFALSQITCLYRQVGISNFSEKLSPYWTFIVIDI